MLKRNEGRILNVASIAAFLPGPFIQMYYASKAFVHSFSLALAMELRGTRVTVTCLYPGLTTSQFHARAGLMRPETYLTMRADVVADIGYRAMMAGKPGIVSGWKNKLIVGCLKLLPAPWAVYMGSRANRRAMKNTVGLQ
jgi:short-subunit dehydrogenase